MSPASNVSSGSYGVAVWTETLIYGGLAPPIKGGGFHLRPSVVGFNPPPTISGAEAPVACPWRRSLQSNKLVGASLLVEHAPDNLRKTLAFIELLNIMRICDSY